jgi:hypothetical protein
MVLEVYLQLVRRFMPSQAFVQFAHDAFEAMTVAATFVANPDNREDATAVSTAVATFCHELVTAIKAMGQKAPAAVAGVLASTSYPLPSALRAKLEPAHKALYKRREELLTGITKAVGFETVKQREWVEKYAYSITPTPLLRNGKLGKWRTFVRNTDWTLAIQLLGSAGACAGLEQENSFSTRVGIEQAEKLWRDAFDATALKEREVEAPAVSASETAPADEAWLPPGVHVKSATGGRILVTASFDPKSFLSAAQSRQVKATTAPEGLRKKLHSRSFEVVASIKDLGDKVTEAAAWLEIQKETRSEVVSAFEAWQDEVKLQAVRTKLQTNFNAEERALLAKLFAAEAATLTATAV